MSGVKSLSDKLKSAPTATSLSGLSMICVDSSGILLRHKPTSHPSVENIDEDLPEGIYIVGSPQGTLPGGGVWNYGILEVFIRWSQTYQRLTNQAGGMAVRAKNSAESNTWGS